MMEKHAKIYVAGHRGMVGSAIVRELERQGYTNILTRTHKELDLTRQEPVEKFFAEEKPEYVFHLAAQPIVRTSYEEPRMTFETNVMGTVNVLECIRHTDSVKSFLNVTTDKVYLNRDDDIAFTEDMMLDGYDPYSNSKSCWWLPIEIDKLDFSIRIGNREVLDRDKNCTMF